MKLLCINSHHIVNLNFLFLPVCVYDFKNCPSQFLSHLELAECFAKTKTKAWILIRWLENSNLLYGENLYKIVSSDEPTLPIGTNNWDVEIYRKKSEKNVKDIWEVKKKLGEKSAWASEQDRPNSTQTNLAVFTKFWLKHSAKSAEIKL